MRVRRLAPNHPSGHLGSFINQGVLAIFIDAVPAEFGEGVQDRNQGFALILVFAVLDGGSMRNTVDAFKTDDGAKPVKIDPVTPRLTFVVRLEVNLAEGIKQLGNGAWSFRVGDDKLSFHD